MSSTRTDDFRINARVRSVLVRHWIDTTKCHFGTIKGKVFIRGKIRKIFGRSRANIEGEKSEEEEKEVDVISELELITRLEDEIRRISGVVSIQYDLENWRKEKGQWRRKVT